MFPRHVQPSIADASAHDAVSATLGDKRRPMLADVLLVALLKLVIALSAGCDRAPTGAAAATSVSDKPARTSGLSPRALRMPLADGFEADSPAAFWLPGDYGTGLYEPGAVTICTEYARNGTRSARVTLNEGDIEQRGDDGKRVERAELDSGHHPLLGQDVWYGFCFLLPPEFPIVDNRLVLASWKQSDVEGSPLIGQRFRGGRHSLTIRPPGAAGGGKSFRLPDIRLGQWCDMVYHVRYSVGEDGTIEVWMNCDRVVSYRGATASQLGADRFYNKVGLYRDRWNEPMTMYVDNYTIGDSYEAVDPLTFDRRR